MLNLKGWGVPLLLGSSIFALYSMDCYYIHQKFMVRNFNEDTKEVNEKESSEKISVHPFVLPNKQSSQRGMNVQFDHYYSQLEHSQVTSTHPNIEEYARAFFTSTAFTPERYLLKLATSFSSENNQQNLNIEEINRLKFQIGDRVGVFRVVDRTEHEILLETDMKTLTWLGLSSHKPNVKTLHFGSAVLEQGLIVSALMPFHHMYSRYLLGFAKQNLLDSFKSSHNEH
ncbi:hypothetical protein C9374_001457 [Naegleria lovaniensis]|uniref:Uncharacterized protein n=1 Tax=Naegleria lovaniensis TaxID=51637 RepID=A0AA88KMR8_NAELO|nr:uncharacterized protein C9374_001457 [Naegleria lovaniensis]KAG2387863.1 hypothetical protein C9374_001457 [Naegleria lovaniensis]